MNIAYHNCSEGSIPIIWHPFPRVTGEKDRVMERTGYCPNCKRIVSEMWLYAGELVEEDYTIAASLLKKFKHKGGE